MLTLDSIPRTHPGVTGRLVENEAVLVLPAVGKVEVLNPVGAFIWAHSDGTRTIREIITRVCDEFEVEFTQAETDTLAFIADLMARGVLSVS